jgi:hypothetical protein
MHFRHHGKNAGEDRVVLQCEAGTYEVTGSRFPMLRLALLMLRHRSWHLMRGEGWVD